jgi:hypothetical protein
MDCPFYNRLILERGPGVRGLVANMYFPVGTVLFKVAGLDGEIVGNARLVNQSYMPNIIIHKDHDGYYAVASMPIYQGREIVWGLPACDRLPNNIGAVCKIY